MSKTSLSTITARCSGCNCSYSELAASVTRAATSSEPCSSTSTKVVCIAVLFCSSIQVREATRIRNANVDSILSSVKERETNVFMMLSETKSSASNGLLVNPRQYRNSASRCGSASSMKRFHLSLSSLSLLVTPPTRLIVGTWSRHGSKPFRYKIVGFVRWAPPPCIAGVGVA